MSSVGSSGAEALAVAPKRARGHLRVAAILDAAATVLAERGYEAATMSEIAVRSKTAIGSLYRFFPTKAVLAEALGERYATVLGERLDALLADASGMSAAGLADALVGLMLDRQQDRAATVALLEVTGDADNRRAALRARLLASLAAILLARLPSKPERAEPAAQIVLQLLKGVSRLYDDVGAGDPALAELRRALALYLADLTL